MLARPEGEALVHDGCQPRRAGGRDRQLGLELAGALELLQCRANKVLLLQLDLVWKVDDPTGAVAIHGVGGAWGLLATGLLGSWENSGGWLRRVGAQCLGLLIAAAVAAIAAALLFIILKRCVALRSLEEHEFDGLDLAEHDIGSYPDFQQTMIKSYHLREA